MMRLAPAAFALSRHARYVRSGLVSSSLRMMSSAAPAVKVS